MWSSPTGSSRDFYYFPNKFGTHLEKELIYINFLNLDIVLKLTTEFEENWLSLIVEYF